MLREQYSMEIITMTRYIILVHTKYKSKLSQLFALYSNEPGVFLLEQVFSVSYS
jgi:hypothetical protein